MWVYPGYASSSVVDTTATFALRIVSNSGITFLSDDDVQCTTTSRLRRLQRARGLTVHPHAETAAEPDDVADVPADHRGIRIHRADDLESRPARELTRDGRANRPEAEVHHANVGHGAEV